MHFYFELELLFVLECSDFTVLLQNINISDGPPHITRTIPWGGGQHTLNPP